MKRLAALAAALIAAFVLAPGRLAAAGPGTDLADSGRLTPAFRGAFVTYWASGDRAYDPGMRQLVDYWFRFHVVKALISAALLAVLIALGVQIWRRFLRARGTRAAGLAAGGVLTTVLAVVSLAAILANVQGVAAPFGSLLPVLIGGSAPVTAALTEASHQIVAGPHSPGLETIISEYVVYHAVMAIQGVIVFVVLVAATVILWRRFARPAERRTRRLLAVFGVFTPLLALAFSAVVVANTMSTVNPLPGVQGLLAGGW